MACRVARLGGFLCLSLFAPVSESAGATLRLFWDASPDPGVVAYNVYWGGASRHYTNVVRVGNVTEALLADLPEGSVLYFAVTALDGAGLESAPSNELMWTAPVTPNAPAAATPVFRVRGEGYLSPDYSGRVLTPGKTYTVTAVPRPGYVFAGWSGSENSTNPRLSFTAQAGLVLEANFVLSPFPALAGNYSGLFCETNAVRANRAGFVSVAVTSRGTYSGRLQLGRARMSFSGQLGLDARTTRTLPRNGAPPLTVQLEFGADGDNERLSGRVAADGEWTAELFGDRAVFGVPGNPCPFAGNYTLAISSRSGDARLPAGVGCGTVRVTRAGRLSFSGALGDGTRVSCSTDVSRAGRWPFFAGLYGGQGVALGWIAFQGAEPSDLRGVIAWCKPPDPSAVSYRAGFADWFEAWGSVYVAPVTGSDSVLPFANGQVVFNGPCLRAPFTNQIALGLNDKVSNLSSNRLTLSFSRSSGAFGGKVTEPATGLWRAFRGVVLRDAGVGLGFLECDGETARVELTR
jgi:uncharacterized repeat protein (TIGR02543 family)